MTKICNERRTARRTAVYAASYGYSRARRPAQSPGPGPYRRRRSVALATFAMIAANGGMAKATPDMMTAASTE